MVVVSICLMNFKYSYKNKVYIIEYQHYTYHNRMVYLKQRI